MSIALTARLRPCVDARYSLVKVGRVAVRVTAEMFPRVAHPIMLDVTSEEEHVAYAKLHDDPR